MDKVLRNFVNCLICFAYIIICLLPIITSKYSHEKIKPVINNRDISQEQRDFLQCIKINNNYFVDEQNRVALFHGTNSVLKKAPWYHEGLLNDTRLKFLQQSGFNVIRLGMMWSGVMPEADQVNASYLNIMQTIVRKLGDHGIYVILDMHQDVLSSKYHAYDGVPRWLVDKLPPARHKYPWPIPKVTAENWFTGYLTEAVGQAFQGIYDNAAGSRDALSMFWEVVVKAFMGERNVLGYELINEPWAGDIYSHPSLLLSGVAGRKNLQPLYDVLNQVIRQHDTQKLVFYEPVTWGIVFGGTRSGSGFSHVPGGPGFANMSVFAYHYYCWLLTPSEAHSVYPIFQKTLCDGILGPKIFKTVQKDIRKLGGASFLTEFGLCGPDGNINSTTTVECDFVMKQADTQLQSWTYWGGENFQNINISSWDLVAPFVRTYAQRIAGIPYEMQFDLKSKHFTLKFVCTPAYQNVSTEIFVPLQHYPAGFVLVKPAQVHSTFNDQYRILYLVATDINIQLKVNIYIKPV